MDSQYFKCNCDTLNSNINFKETQKFNPKIIYKSFYSVFQYSNYKILKCYKLALSINSITLKNIGSIIIIIDYLIFFIFFIIYLTKGKNQIGLILMKALKRNLEKKGLNKKKIKEIEKKYK